MAERKRFTDEFKSGAVHLVVEEGLTKAEAARHLGVTATTVGAWVKEVAPDGQVVDSTSLNG